MTLNKLLINEYENVLLGNVNGISPQMFSAAAHLAEEEAVELLKYIVEEILRWKPEEFAMRLDKDLVEKMKWNDIISHIHFPQEVNLFEELDYTYLAVKLYPKEVVYNFRENVINVYRRMLANQCTPPNKKDAKELRELKQELSIDPQYRKIKERKMAIYKFPKNYMSGAIGVLRAGICLQYMISNFMAFHSIAEIYEFFADEERAIWTLKKYKLYTVYRELFESPLEYLHTALPEDKKDYLLYNYYSFKKMYK